MAGTLALKVRELVVGTGRVGNRSYLDHAPSNTKFPYVTMAPQVSDVSTLVGDGRVQASIRSLQVDLWEDVEDDTLTPALNGALDGAQIADADELVYGVIVENIQRFYEPDTKRVHHAYTLKLTYGR